MGAKSAGGGGQAQSGGGGLAGLSGAGGKGDMFKNLAKLGGIAIGVVAIVGLVKKLTSMFVDSSPMLKQMLKLFNFGVMMLLRPIGDFIGFLLRPIMVMLLVRFIIPFYRTALPFMQKAGDWIGNKIVPFIEGIFNALIGVGEFIVGKLTFNGDMAERGWNRLLDTFGLAIKATEKGTQETFRVGQAVNKQGIGMIKTVSDLVKMNVSGKVTQSMSNLKSSVGFAGAGVDMQRMMKSFAQITGGSSRYGFERLANSALGGLSQNALGIMGAGSAQIQGQISSGDFNSVQEALKAYIKYVTAAGQSTGLTNPSGVEQQFIELNIGGSVFGIDDLDQHIADVIQRVGARGKVV